MIAALPSQPGTRLRLSLPCDLAKVRSLTAVVLDFLAAEGLAEEEVKACELALVEACNNAVLYATESGRSLPIEVEAICDSTQVELKVDDHTCGFELPEMNDLPDAESENGRGLFIIRSLMDRVSYGNGLDRNSLTMQKLRTTPLSKSRLLPHGVEEYHRKLMESEQIIHDMATELNSCYESLSAIFRSGAELGKTNNLEKFSYRLCNDLVNIVNAEWFILRISIEDESRLIVFTASDPTLELGAVNLGRTDDEAHFAEVKAALSRQDVWFDRESALAENDPLQLTRPGAVGLVHPCHFSDSLIGTLSVGKMEGGSGFTAAQTNIIHTFADFLAIQIVNARLREEHVGNRLISHELQIAKNIQRALLPKTLPQLVGFELSGYCESARQVGGDFYDVLPVNEHSVLLIIADVMGKGIPAAMFAAILRSVLRAAPEMASQPGALLGRVNHLLFDELSDVEMFITASLAYIDVNERKMVAASAGHCPAILIGKGQKNPMTISPDGLPIGILQDATFAQQVVKMPAECRLLMYTDGLTDTQNNKGEFFGEARLLEWVRSGAHAEESADLLKEGLACRLKQFQGHSALYDDQTFLILSETGSAKAHS